MTAKETYQIWAPSKTKWTDWVRPVPFIGIDHPEQIHELIDYEIPSINYIKEVKNNTAIIIDINGIDSIKEGIALAKIGYRPIPIFNGTNPPAKTLSTTENPKKSYCLTIPITANATNKSAMNYTNVSRKNMTGNTAKTFLWI